MNPEVEQYSSEVERGSGTVVALMLIVAVFAAGYLLSALAVTHQARWHAQVVADLGALAGAGAWRTGFDPCETAGAAVVRNKGQMSGCELRANGAVKVTANISVSLIGARTVTARSIAAPRPPPPFP
jgi:secretion/DNA translocation related TadE-like protein